MGRVRWLLTFELTGAAASMMLDWSAMRWARMRTTGGLAGGGWTALSDRWPSEPLRLRLRLRRPAVQRVDHAHRTKRSMTMVDDPAE